MPEYPNEESKLDHFKIYEIDKIEIERKADLEGQFDYGPKPVDITSIIWFANPVQKNEERIIDKNAHFLGYSFIQQEPRRVVDFSRTSSADSV